MQKLMSTESSEDSVRRLWCSVHRRKMPLLVTGNEHEVYCGFRSDFIVARSVCDWYASTKAFSEARPSLAV